MPHPGIIIKKNYLKNIGLFNLKYKISSDFDFFIKAKNNLSTKYYYYNNSTIKMSLGGASSGFKNILKANIECYNSLRENKIKFPLLFIVIKILRKLTQFF